MCILDNASKIEKAHHLMYPNSIMVHHMEDSNIKFGDASEYGYDSWMDYWKKWKGQSEKEVPSSFECPCCYKSKGNIVGAHVEDNEGKPYITPVCKDCNSRAINDAAFRDLNFPVANDELAPLPQQWQKPLHLSK